MISLEREIIKKLENNATDVTQVGFTRLDGGRTDNLRFMAGILETNTNLELYSLSDITGSATGAQKVEEGIALVAAALKKNETLKTLNLYGCGFSDNDLAALADMLVVNKTLAVLNLSACSISPKGLELLGVGLAANKGLKSINLASNNLGADVSAFKTFAISLQQNEFLTHLDFSNNNITAPTAEFLGDILQHNKTLKKLGLRHNKTLKDDGIVALAKGLKVNKTISELDVWGNDIGPRGGKALADSLQEHPNITILNLGFNEIGEEGAIALGNTLKTNKSLISLWLLHCNINDKGGEKLISALKKHPSLRRLCIENNLMGHNTAKALGQLLSQNQILSVLYAKHNNIGTEGGIALAEGLRNNHGLTILDVSENQLGSVAASAFAGAIKNHTTLVNLAFNKNQIGDIGAKAIILALMQGNNILAELELYENEITPKSINDFKRLIENNPHLTVLCIGSNSFGVNGIQKFSESIANNRTLSKFSLYNTAEKSVKKPETIAAFARIGIENKTLIDFSFPENRIPGDSKYEVSRAIKRNETQAFALIDAVYKGDIEEVQNLLKNGVSPYFRCYSYVGSHTKWFDPQERKVFSFKPALPSVVCEFKKPEDGETLLHMAIRKRHLNILKILIEDIRIKPLLHIKNNENKTALQLAKNSDNPEFYRAFVDAKLVRQKRAAEEQKHKDAPASKRARNTSISDVAPLPEFKQEQKRQCIIC